MNERLKQLRKALGLRQREMAERLNVNVGSVGHWEKDEEVPKARIYQICKEFNVNRTWFETGEGEMFEPEEKIMDVREAQRAFVQAVLRRMTPEQLQIVSDAVYREAEKLERQKKDRR